MDLGGLEPPTSRLSGVRSNRLSYKSICIRNHKDLLAGAEGIEPSVQVLETCGLPLTDAPNSGTTTRHLRQEL